MHLASCRSRSFPTDSTDEAYLKAYPSMAEAKQALGQYFAFFNQCRRHQGIGNQTPDALYYAEQESALAA